jgi:hypothetical protein
VVADDASHASESDARASELFRVAQKLKYAEEFLRVLYIKSNTVIANKVYGLALVARAPGLQHG